MELSLEIFRLDRNGSVTRRINCLPSRITVFRGNEADRAAYQTALLGEAAQTAFSVLIGKTPLVNTPCNYIGMGPDFSPAYSGNVEAYLTAYNLKPAESERLLLSLSLGGLHKCRCTELNLEQQRILRLLAIEAQPEYVHILCDPFRGLSVARREEFAQRLVQFVAEKKGLVVITHLGERPDCWIENEYVSRVELERPRAATIGFGSTGLKREDIMRALSQEAKTTVSTVLKKPQVNSNLRQFTAIFALALSLGIIITLYKHPYLIIASPQPEAVAGKAAPDDTSAEEERELVSNQVFPDDIIKGIQTAFLQPDSVLADLASKSGPPVASASKPMQVSVPSYTTQTDETAPKPSLDERREEIRRRFLAAIERSNAAEAAMFAE